MTTLAQLATFALLAGTMGLVFQGYRAWCER